MAHETVVAQQVLSVALDELQRQAARRVRRIRLSIGELEGIAEISLRHAFEVVSKGTAAEGAELDIQVVPGRVVCDSCGAEIKPGSATHGGVPSGLCPVCGGRPRVVEGRGWRLQSVRVLL